MNIKVLKRLANQKQENDDKELERNLHTSSQFTDNQFSEGIMTLTSINSFIHIALFPLKLVMLTAQDTTPFPPSLRSSCVLVVVNLRCCLVLIITVMKNMLQPSFNIHRGQFSFIYIRFIILFIYWFLHHSKAKMGNEALYLLHLNIPEPSSVKIYWSCLPSLCILSLGIAILSFYTTP